MTVTFSITHNISHSKGWGRYKASTADGDLIQSSTGNDWVSAGHSAETVEGTIITAVLQTIERSGKTKKETVSTDTYSLVAEQGATAELGYWNGLQVIVLNAKIA